MRSLSFKLTLAFLLIGLTGAFLVAVISQQRTQAAFSQFILDREQQTMAQYLLAYYQAYGSWEGVAENLPVLLQNQPPSFDDGPEVRREGISFTLAGPDKTIILAPNASEVGK